jgi:hypothetical protein
MQHSYVPFINDNQSIAPLVTKVSLDYGGSLLLINHVMILNKTAT